MLAVGDVPAAHDAADELTALTERYDTPALRAIAGHARGAVLLAEGDARAAAVALRAAWQGWRELEAPYEAARVRVLVGLGCRALGDEDTATMELDAARSAFARLGAAPDLARLATPERRGAASRGHGLTARELQVLRLMAAGKTNHAIATDLVLADKTVDRHVSNIYTKLGVSSRAAATAIPPRSARCTGASWPAPRSAAATSRWTPAIEPTSWSGAPGRRSCSSTAPATRRGSCCRCWRSSVGSTRSPPTGPGWG
jgi:DNA-binding NarL/FixJ family response regulator